MLRRIIVSCVLGALVLVAAAPESEASVTPITTCGQVVTASAVLAHSLYCPGTSGVVVGAAGVTIDLKGFTLRGDGSFGTAGVDDSGGFAKIAVKNGVVRNFNFGVYSEGDTLSVSAVVASGNGNGVNGAGISALGASASITSSNAAGNAGFGIVALGASASIASSTASGNLFDGIFAGDSARIQSSSAYGNSLDGILVGGDSASIKSSTASANAGNGIAVGGDLASIKSSVTSANASHGIVVSGNAASITSNRAEANGYPGGASNLAGLGIYVHNFATAPVGTNIARANDDPEECSPISLC